MGLKSVRFCFIIILLTCMVCSCKMGEKELFIYKYISFKVRNGKKVKQRENVQTHEYREEGVLVKYYDDVSKDFSFILDSPTDSTVIGNSDTNMYLPCGASINIDIVENECKDVSDKHCNECFFTSYCFIERIENFKINGILVKRCHVFKVLFEGVDLYPVKYYYDLDRKIIVKVEPDDLYWGINEELVGIDTIYVDK